MLSRPLTDENNGLGEAWTPIVASCDVVIEVNLPPGTDRRDLQLNLGGVQVGYRGLHTAHDLSATIKSGSCNVDVVCGADDGDQHAPIDDWRAEIPSVAIFSYGGFLKCSGSMLNNVLGDQTPFFLTARHCDVVASNAASVVTYWKYETTTCQGTPDGEFNNFLTGSVHLIENEATDMTLVRMNEAVPPEWIGDILSFAGWDRSGSDATSATAIHHPSTDEKRIRYENPASNATIAPHTVRMRLIKS